MRKGWCHDHKSWTSDNLETREWYGQMNLLHALPYIRRKCLRLENTQVSLQSGMPNSNSETRRKLCDGLGSNIMVQYYVVLTITLHGRTTAREYLDRLSNQVHPMIQTLFPKNDAIFQDDNAPSHTLNCSVMV
jgi:hypothetical protein